MMAHNYSAEAHLEIAIRNCIVLLIGTFVIGALTGWALSQWARAPIGAGLGAIIGTGFLLWFCRMYYATRGLLHTTGIGRSQ